MLKKYYGLIISTSYEWAPQIPRGLTPTPEPMGIKTVQLPTEHRGSVRILGVYVFCKYMTTVLDNDFLFSGLQCPGFVMQFNFILGLRIGHWPFFIGLFGTPTVAFDSVRGSGELH